MMRFNDQTHTRRHFLKAAGLGALGTVAGGRLLGQVAGAATPPKHRIFLAATDGYMRMPGREDNPLYIFGFIPVPDTTVANLENATLGNGQPQYKGRAQHVAPILDTLDGEWVYLKLTNLGLVQRPDLTDSHTLHWHGFRTPSAQFDGVPEVSVAVPIERQFTYFYAPHNPGTYMYHCHFEDVEHVQMGMTSIVYVRPTTDTPTDRYAYPNASTRYDRHFAILLNEVEERQHDADRDIQEFIMTDYDPQYFTLNGRAYPDTTKPNNDPGFLTQHPNYGDEYAAQPVSALVMVNAGDRVLLRLANLGYLQHSMELPGIPMQVVGQDATFLGASSGTYTTNTLYLGPGEARDVLFTAPAFDNTSRSIQTDGGARPFNTYYFKNRDYRRLSNPGVPGPGGMMTEVRVYQPGTLAAQATVGDTNV